MNEKIETQGKTVDEAVNEALLRLGARRDEVDVTVLDEPKGGFLGLLGGRPAKVEVTRKRSHRRGQRRSQGGNTAHEFGDGGGSDRKSRSSRGNQGGSRRNNSERKPDQRRTKPKDQRGSRHQRILAGKRVIKIR